MNAVPPRMDDATDALSQSRRDWSLERKAIELTKPRTGTDDVFEGGLASVTEFDADVACISELRMKNATVAEVMAATSSDQG